MSTVLPLPLAEPRPHVRADQRREHESNKLAKRLRHQVGRAIADFGMIEDGDKVMVCLSGGKDSYTMLDILLQLQKKAPVRFELVAVNLDQKQPDFPEHVLPTYLESIGVPYKILEQDTYSVVTRVVPEGKTMCSLCSRLRRGALYSYAAEQGFTKIALGHHRDDLVATFFLNLFFHAKLAGMPPKLLSDDGRHVVIRPLAYVREDDIGAYARGEAVPDHPLQPVRLAGEPAAQAGQEDDGCVGARIARPDREHRARAGRHPAVAAERPETVRLPRARPPWRRRAAGCARMAGRRAARERRDIALNHPASSREGGNPAPARSRDRRAQRRWIPSSRDDGTRNLFQDPRCSSAT